MNKLSETIGRIRNTYRNHLWQGRLILAALIFLLVLVVVRISLPYTIVYSSVYWLGKQGISAQIDDISIDVDRGTFSIHQAKGIKDGEEVFRIGKASIDWEWRPLAAKTIHIKGVELEDFNLEAEQHADAIVVAGIVIRDDAGVEQQPEETEDDVAWGSSLNQIDFKDLNFCFRQFDGAYDDRQTSERVIDYCGDVGLLAFSGDFDLEDPDPSDSKPEHTMRTDGSITVEGLTLFNNKLDGTLIAVETVALKDIKINGINDISLNTLEIAELDLLQNAGHARHQHAIEFDRLALDNIAIKNTSSVAIAALSLNKPVVSMALEASGKYRYEPWLPPQEPEPQTSEPAPAEPSGKESRFTLQISTIGITDSELCYQQAESKSTGTPALDYCLKLGDTRWQGDIAVTTPSAASPLELALKGRLSAAGLLATNNLLKRDLLSFEQLAVNDILINGIDDAAAGSVVLKNLAGLELTSTEDKHTVTLGGVDISAFSYRKNTVAVNRIALSQLGLEVTQNADGSLDFDKWNPGAPGDTKEPEKSGDSKETEQPLAIKVGEFSLDTTRPVRFADMTVSPAMEVGLEEIHFSVKQLDSTQPAQKSPIELSAKTMRHSTIDLKGVVMPFDSKPSFDATGKIAGLDLRVISPKVEQAVGHIIKSGQMDAEIKLLSEAGQLDSKISLVLHHFNLKAKSKEEAAALDKTFGMPINQSLVLLKDKNGKIKLDIPITGDVTNPEFDPTDAIIKATTKATTVTLVTFYTPYGLAFAGGNLLLNLAKALNFDPLVFEAGSSVLTGAHKEQLAKLAELLTERPGVHLTLCGFTNLNDRSKLTTEIIDPAKIKPASPEGQQKLKQLGSERQDRVKDYLVEVGKIAHDRLVLCEPEHKDDAEALAGVEISI